MNKEVEEILENIKQHNNQENVIILTENEYTHLINYITNLQEENEKLKCSLMNRIKQSDMMDKAIEYINSTDFIYDEQYKKKDRLEKILNGVELRKYIIELKEGIK